MRFGIIPKLLLPLSIVFAISTYLYSAMILKEFSSEQIQMTKNAGLNTANSVAMLLDTTSDQEILRRMVTTIALNENILQALIIKPPHNKILASSKYRYAKHQLEDLPNLLRTAFLLAKEERHWTFTDVENGHYALSYPITVIAANQPERLNYMLLIYFDTLNLDIQYAQFQTQVFIIAGGIFVTLVMLTFILLTRIVRHPLKSFENALKHQSSCHQFQVIELSSNDEFADMAEEFNRMRQVEAESLELAQKAMRAAEALATQKSQFLANMSHELRTPINGILGMAQVAKDAKTLPQVQKYLPKLISSSYMLLSVVNDILDFSKLDQNQLNIDKHWFVLSDALDQVAQLITISTDQKDLSFDIDLDTDCPFQVELDRQRFNQILLNLLNNAVKFTENGSIQLSISFQWEGAEHGRLLVNLSDTGIGIAPENIKHLFDAFEQADNSISRKYGGTGLGLAICHELLSLMGGTIDVTSELGQGSCFMVTIPCKAKTFEHYLAHDLDTSCLKPLNVPNDITNRLQHFTKLINVNAKAEEWDKLSQEQQELNALLKNKPVVNEQTLIDLLIRPQQREEHKPAERKQSISHSKSRLLLVEDNEINAIVATELLKNLGYKVQLAKNGQEAVDAFSNHSFALILMDVQMPIKDGYQATQEIRQLDASIPVIGLSANVLPEDVDKAISSGMNDYLHKPIVKEELANMLIRYLP